MVATTSHGDWMTKCEGGDMWDCFCMRLYRCGDRGSTMIYSPGGLYKNPYVHKPQGRVYLDKNRAF